MLVFPVIVIPLSREMKLGFDSIVTYSVPMYFLYGALAIPWGYISDRFSPRFVMAAGNFFGGVGFIGASFSKDLPTIMIFLAVTGVGCSAYHPSGLALLSKGLKQRGRALGLNGLAGNLGIAAAPLVAGLGSFFFDWRITLLVSGLIGVTVAVFSVTFPFSVGRHEDLQKGTSMVGKEALRTFLILCIVLVFSGLMYRGFSIIIPSFFELKLQGIIKTVSDFLKDFTSDKSSSTLVAALLTSAIYFLGMAGQLIGGKVADSIDLRKGYLLFFSLAFPFLIMIPFLNGWMMILAAGLFALFSLGMQPIENSLVAMITPPQWRSLSYGIKFTLVFGAGSLSVKFAGLIEKSYGLTNVFYLLAAYCVLVIFFIAVLMFFSRGSSLQHD